MTEPVRRDCRSRQVMEGGGHEVRYIGTTRTPPWGGGQPEGGDGDILCLTFGQRPRSADCRTGSDQTGDVSRYGISLSANSD